MSGFKNIDVTELHRLQAEGKITLIDVRTNAEVANGIIEGALHIPLNLVPTKVNEISDAQPVVLYCQSGGRSSQASAFLIGRGLKNIHNLQGGILAWSKQGLPLSQLDKE